MNAEALATDLAAFGIACEVEARERLAVVRPMADPAQLILADTRAAVLKAARLRGFTHVALEIGGADDAPLPRD